MMKKILLIACILAGCNSQSQPPKKSGFDLSPEMKIVEKKTFDFNKDGIPDVLLVLRDSTKGDTARRPVWILEGKKDSTYDKVLISDKVIPCAGCTEIGDNTYNDLLVTDSVISFTRSFFGQHGSEADTVFVFKYDPVAKHWYLVDVNYNKMCVDNEGNKIEGCDEMKVHVKGEQLQPVVLLQDFDIYSFDPMKYI